MLYLFFTIIFLLPVFMGIGKLSELVFGRFWNGISGLLISGMFLMSMVWMLMSFFTGIGFWVETGTIIAGLFSFFYFKLFENGYDFVSKNRLIFLSGLVVILFAGTFYPFILDYFGYYVPTIKWISEFGLVKGISNLDLLLGQMSIWHILQAGFSHFADPFLRLNTVFLVVYFIYACEKKSWLHLAIIPVLLLFAQSPSPDLPVIGIALMILDEVFSGNQRYAVLFMLSAFVFTIKPTMIWLPLFTFSYAVFVHRSGLKFLGMGILVFTVFIFKNIWCFGFPVFPVQIGDVDVPWKPNSVLLQLSSQTAIEKTFDMQYSYKEIQNFSTLEYLKNWFFLKGIKAKIHLVFVLSLLALLCFSFWKKNKITSILCISILVKSILVLIFSAQYRFFLDVFFVVFFVLAYQKISKKMMMSSFFALSLFFIGFLSFPGMVKKFVPSFKLGQFMLGFQKKQIWEPAYFVLNEYDTYKIGNLKFQVVKGYPFSFDIPIPAISPEFLMEDLQAGIFPQAFDENNLKYGFYWRKLNQSEKNKLFHIIEKSKADYKKRIAQP